MGDDPGNRKAQAGSGEAPRSIPAAPPAEEVHNTPDRRQKAEALRNSEETTRVLLNAAPTAAFMIDTQGILLAVNQIATKRFGLAAEAMVGRPISEFSPPPVVESRRQKGIEAVRTGAPVFFEDTCDGRTFSTSIHPVCDERGQVIQLAVYSKDITEEKRSEEERRKLTIQLQQAQKMEAIGTLAGGIAHDFNNLLMAIQGNVSLMLFDMEPSHPHHRILTNIEKLIRSGADLTSKLLGYARKGKYESRPLAAERPGAGDRRDLRPDAQGHPHRQGTWRRTSRASSPTRARSSRCCSTSSSTRRTPCRRAASSF